MNTSNYNINLYLAYDCFAGILVQLQIEKFAVILSPARKGRILVSFSLYRPLE